MSASTPLPKEHPLRKAWDTYKQTPEYENTCRWLLDPGRIQHVEGSLWGAFEQGWRMRESTGASDGRITTKSHDDR